MTVTTVDAADVDFLLDIEDDEDLAATLVAAGAGTEFDDPGEDSALGTLGRKSKAASKMGGNWFRDRANRIFRRAWPKVKTVVCQAYKDRPDLQVGGKDWLTYLIGVALPVLGIGSAFVGAVILWAAKEGLDALCEVDT